MDLKDKILQFDSQRNYLNFIIENDFSTLNIDFSNQDDQKVVNKLFIMIIYSLDYYFGYCDESKNFLFPISQFEYVKEKIKNKFSNIFDIEVIFNSYTNLRNIGNLIIKIICNNYTKYYRYNDMKVSILSPEEFEEYFNNYKNVKFLKLKEMEF